MILFSFSPTLNNAYATPVFGVPGSLDPSDPFGGSRVAVSGSNVFSVWVDQCGDIQYARSIDDGNTGTFTQAVFPISGDTGCFGLTGTPQVAASGSNVHVVWVDVGLGGIFVQSSSDDGFTFNGVDITDGVPPFPAPPTFVSADIPTLIEISATGNYLYVVWLDSISSNVQIAASADNGVTFTLDTLDASGTSLTPVVSSSGDNAYVAWQNPSGDIMVKKITYDLGLASFDFTTATQNLSGTGTATSPKIVATGDNVYTVWRDTEIAGTNGEIYFSKSIDNGDTFNGGTAGSPGSPVNLSDNTGISEDPNVTATGDNVFVIWRDTLAASLTNYDILLQSSSNTGVTFNGGSPGTPRNLSDNSGFSTTPKISAFGTEAYAVWSDDTNEPSGGDILSRTIFDSGDRVGGIKNISQSTDTSFNPKVASSASNVSVIWDDNTISPTLVSFNNAIPSTVDVGLDKTQYVLGDTATITVVAGTGLSIEVDILKNGGFEFSRSLSEIDSTGVYTGTISFTPLLTDGPSGILNAASLDIIQVTELVSGQTTFASMLATSTVSFTPVTVAYDRGAIAHITVTDIPANTDSLTPQFVTVTVTSLTDTTGISMTLTETGPDTGVFGNTINNKLIFMTSENLWPPNSQITITQPHTGADTTSGSDTISEIITSTSDPAGISLLLTETGGSTGIFSGVLTLSDVDSIPGSTIKAVPGDIVSAIRGTAVSNALVDTGPSNIKGISVNSDPLTDTVTVTYGASTAVATVEKQFSSGGGGGGLGRAGFVVNVVAGISTLGGGGGGNSPPSFGKSSFAIISGGTEGFGGILNDNNVNTLEQTKTFKVGEKAVLRFDFIEGGGIGKIEHIGLYANVRDGQKRQDSDAFIYYDPLKSPQVTVHDPNGLFSEANFDLLQMDATKFVLKYDLTFAKPMPISDLILESWNIKKWSTINKISNAIEVISSGIVQEEESEPVKTFLEDVTDDQVIPVWIKSNAKWWSDDEIDNENFISGIEYLVNEGIIKVSLTDTTDTSISEIPTWIKNNAGWWAEEMISDDEFLLGIEWLVKNKIIIV